MEASAALTAWERRPEESSQAYGAFRVYLELGPDRSFVATARQLGKSESLIRRWAGRHNWRQRTYLWDLARARESEAALAQERQEALREQWEDAKWFRRVSKYKLRSLVIQDPETGQRTLSRELRVADAERLYRLALDIQRTQVPSAAPTDATASDQALEMLPEEVLQEIIALAKERAYPNGGSDHDNDPS